MSKFHTTHPGQSFRGQLKSLLWFAISHIPWCDCDSILVCSQGISFLSSAQRQGRARLLLRAFSDFSVLWPWVGLCAVHKLVEHKKDQTKADLPLINSQTFQHLQAMQQLNRSFQKASVQNLMMMITSGHFSCLSLDCFLSSDGYMLGFTITKLMSSRNISFEIKNSWEKKDMA